MNLLDVLIDPLLALSPVVAFLLGLLWMDSFKLVGLRSVSGSLLAGCGAALGAFWINPALLEILPWDFSTYTRYGSPFVEETLKAIPLFWLLARNRIGFPIDAAVYGFSVGTGFALAENLYYLQEHPQAQELVWVIRGFGTALLHGGCTAVFAILSRIQIDRSTRARVLRILPGWLAAVSIHSFYNHFFLSPLSSTLLVLLTLPLLVASVFLWGERILRAWMMQGFDAHADMIALLDSGTLRESRVGICLDRLRHQFPGTVVADMLCYLRLHTELSLRVKGVLMLREQGFEPRRDPEITEKLQELDYLSRTIGKTGIRLLLPFLGKAPQDLWQLFLLKRR